MNISEQKIKKKKTSVKLWVHYPVPQGEIKNILEQIYLPIWVSITIGEILRSEPSGSGVCKFLLFWIDNILHAPELYINTSFSALSCLEFFYQIKMLYFSSSCFSLLCAGITGVNHHTYFFFLWLFSVYCMKELH
jgi:hypothetical protein